MHERTQRKTIHLPKSAEPSRYSINLNNYNKRTCNGSKNKIKYQEKLQTLTTLT